MSTQFDKFHLNPQIIVKKNVRGWTAQSRPLYVRLDGPSNQSWSEYLEVFVNKSCYVKSAFHCLLQNLYTKIVLATKLSGDSLLG